MVAERNCSNNYYNPGNVAGIFSVAQKYVEGPSLYLFLKRERLWDCKYGNLHEKTRPELLKDFLKVRALLCSEARICPFS